MSKESFVSFCVLCFVLICVLVCFVMWERMEVGRKKKRKKTHSLLDSVFFCLSPLCLIFCFCFFVGVGGSVFCVLRSLFLCVCVFFIPMRLCLRYSYAYRPFFIPMHLRLLSFLRISGG